MPDKISVYTLGSKRPRLVTTKCGTSSRYGRPRNGADHMANVACKTNNAQNLMMLVDLFAHYLVCLSVDKREREILKRSQARIERILSTRPAGSGVIFQYDYADDLGTRMRYCIGGGVCGAGNSYEEAVANIDTAEFCTLRGRKNYHAHSSKFLWIKKESGAVAVPPSPKPQSAAQDPIVPDFDIPGLSMEEEDILLGSFERQRGIDQITEAHQLDFQNFRQAYIESKKTETDKRKAARFIDKLQEDHRKKTKAEQERVKNMSHSEAVSEYRRKRKALDDAMKNASPNDSFGLESKYLDETRALRERLRESG